MQAQQTAPQNNLVIADVRAAAGQGPQYDDYLASRVPGAVFVDLNRDLADVEGDLLQTGRHPLPSASAFAAAMAAKGIGDDTAVVAYDATGGGIAAARLWYMLDALGIEAAVLDGGLASWTGPLESGQPAPVTPGQFTERPWPTSSFVSADEVAAMLASEGTQLLDARSAERYAGQGSPGLDPQPGHVPGAISMPWTDNLGPDGRFLSADALADRFRDVDDVHSVSYCGSGVTACHNLLALRVAGKGGRLYPGSWSQWAADPDRPIENPGDAST